MGTFTPFIFIAVFGGGIIIDIIGHRKRGLYRTLFDKIFLTVLFVLLGVSVLVTLNMFNSVGADDEPGRYIAYQYLLENDPESALYIVTEDSDLTEDSEKLIKIMAESELGDYEDLYFDAHEFLGEKGHDAGQMHIVEELAKIAEDALDGGWVSGSEKSRLLKSSYSQMGIQETDSLKDLYQIDKSIREGNAGSIQSEKISGILNEFYGYDIVQKIAISYYLTQDDFKAAEALSQRLVDNDETEANYVLYIDVMAQSVYSSETEKLAESGDPEVVPLVEKAVSSYETAMSANGNDIETIENNAEQSEKYYEDAKGVYYQRLINFLVLKQNQGFDTDGMISLELLKLRILKGDYDEAEEDIRSLLDRIESLDISSPIREDLLRVRDLKEKMREDGSDSGSPEFIELCDAAADLLNNASCMIFTYGDDNINNRAYKIIASMVYADLPGLSITGTDTSKYPKISAGYSLNIRKKNIIGGPGEFYADDFTFTDQGEVITDCKLDAVNGYSGRSAVFVLDMQNSDLSEDDLKELKDALYGFTTDYIVADKYAFVNSTSYIQTELTDNLTEIRYSIRNINTQYAVSAYTCLNTACDLLERTGSEDDRVIIYVTDGSTLSEEELANAVNRARQDNIRIYGISFGTGADSYTDSLCDTTYGLSVSVPYFDQLGVFSKRLSEFMNYRYTAVFTAETDTGNTTDRVFEVKLNDPEVSDSIVYAGGGS